MLAKIIDYLKFTKAELRHVSWPSKKQTVNFTLLVIGVSLAAALFLGLFDTIFGYLVKEFIL